MFIISATVFCNYRILISYIDIFSWSPDPWLVFIIFCMTELFSTLLIWLGVNPFFLACGCWSNASCQTKWFSYFTSILFIQAVNSNQLLRLMWLIFYRCRSVIYWTLSRFFRSTCAGSALGKNFSGIVLHLSARAAPMACLPRTRLHPPAEGTETVSHCGSTWKERAASWFRFICIEIRAQGYMDGLRSVLHGRRGTARLQRFFFHALGA